MVPCHGENRGPIYGASESCDDEHVHLVDLGSELQSAIPFKMGSATWLTGDGLHIRAVHHGLIAAGIARQSQERISESAILRGVPLAPPVR